MLDRAYSAVANRKPVFYEGWGETLALEYLLSLSNPSTLYRDRVPEVSVLLDQTWSDDDCQFQTFSYQSPYRFLRRWKGRQLAYQLPAEIAQGRLLFVRPKRSFSGAVAIHFASTGDEGFSRRLRFMAKPLAKRGVASVLIENPLYGSRRLPGKDTRPSTITDFLRMSRANQDEGIAIARALLQAGYGPLAFVGISMGGYMAIASASRFGRRVAVAACIPSHSAGPVYTNGVMARSVDWHALEAGLGDWAAATRNRSKNVWARQTLERLLGLGNVVNLPRLKAPAALRVVNARRDAYIPRESQNAILACYPQSRCAELDYGHVGAVLWGSDLFVDATLQAFAGLRA